MQNLRGKIASYLKIENILIVDSDGIKSLRSKCQNDGEHFINFCGLLGKHEL